MLVRHRPCIPFEISFWAPSAQIQILTTGLVHGSFVLAHAWSSAEVLLDPLSRCGHSLSHIASSCNELCHVSQALRQGWTSQSVLSKA